MAIAAMANVTSMEKRELLQMQREFNEIAMRQGNSHTITKDEFEEALSRCNIVESDSEILDRLFTMLDKTGDQQINFREFICGISPLITGTVEQKLHFAFEMYDVDGTGVVKEPEMNFILASVNDTSSYFGDPVMTRDDISTLVDEIFEKYSEEQEGTGIRVLTYKGFMAAVSEHPKVVAFVRGEGTVKYGQAK